MTDAQKKIWRDTVRTEPEEFFETTVLQMLLRNYCCLMASVAAVQQETEPGLSVSAKAYARGVKALDELRFRRTGLGVSVLIILAIIVGLWLKIRQLEHREARRPRPEDHGL